MPPNWPSTGDRASAALTRLDTGERALAVCLAAVAGYVDAVGFLHSGGYFVSFMSGNSTRLAVGIAGAGASASIPACLIGSFVGGVVLGSICGALAGVQRRAIVLLIVSALLACAATLDRYGECLAAIGVIAFAMGAENAVFERPGGASIGLTYMTGALARIGQGIAANLLGSRGLEWLSYLALWGGLAGGAIVGATLHGHFGVAALWVPAGVSLALATVTQRMRAR